MLNLILVGGFWTTFLEAALVDSDYDLALLLPKGFRLHAHSVYWSPRKLSGSHLGP